MASPHAVPIIRELGIRESYASGTLAVFGTADHATSYPSCCAKAKHHQTNRLAYFSSLSTLPDYVSSCSLRLVFPYIREYLTT